MRYAQEICIYDLYIRRSVATSNTDSTFKGRLKAHDTRIYAMEAPGSCLSPIQLPGGPVSPPDNRGSREVLNKRSLVPFAKKKLTLVTDETETIG